MYFLSFNCQFFFFLIEKPKYLKPFGGYSGGAHLFPFRTEKLSPPAQMVLNQIGRVCRRRILLNPAYESSQGFFLPRIYHFAPTLLDLLLLNSRSLQFNIVLRWSLDFHTSLTNSCFLNISPVNLL